MGSTVSSRRISRRTVVAVVLITLGGHGAGACAEPSPGNALGSAGAVSGGKGGASAPGVGGAGIGGSGSSGSGGSSGSSGSGGSSGGSGSGGGGGGGSGSSGGGGGSGGGGSSSSSSGGSGTGSGGKCSQGIGGGAGAGGEGGATPSDTTIVCGSSFCSAVSEICCALGGSPYCLPPDAAKSCQYTIDCDGPEDCAPGMRCCRKQDAMGAYAGDHCESSCGAAGGSDSSVDLCHATSDCLAGAICFRATPGTPSCVPDVPGAIRCPPLWGQTPPCSAGEVCCVTNGGDIGITKGTCASATAGTGGTGGGPSGPCPTGGAVALYCDGPEDCAAGEVCCYAGNKATCSASCCDGIALCNDDTDCALPRRCVYGAAGYGYPGNTKPASCQ